MVKKVVDVRKLQSSTTHHEDRAAELPPEIFLFHIVRVFHFAPPSRLPRHFQTARRRRLFDAEALGLLRPGVTATTAQSPAHVCKTLAPLAKQPRADAQTLAREHRPFEAHELPRAQPGQPAADDVARLRRLLRGDDGAAVEARVEVDAGPDARCQVGNDGFGGVDLQRAQRRQGRVCVFWRRRRPAEEGVGVEVREEGLDDVVPYRCG